jgi:hypothetical protein
MTNSCLYEMTVCGSVSRGASGLQPFHSQDVSTVPGCIYGVIQMLKTLLALQFVLISSHASSQVNPVIQITKSERTSSSIVVEGVAAVIPSGTKMRVTVKSINGKPVDENRDTIKSVEDVYVASDGTFSATIKRYGSLARHDFPEGKYQLEFFAGFARSWQSVDVAKAAGVTLDEQGRSDLGEPRALPRSSDLRPQTIGGAKVRYLQALRTIEIRQRTGEAPAYMTKTIRLEIHDFTAKRNPVRALAATNLLFREVPEKVGRLKSTEAVALVCIGPFQNGFGYLANDLYHSGGNINRDFSTTFATTLSELCYQQEDSYNKRKR